MKSNLHAPSLKMLTVPEFAMECFVFFSVAVFLLKGVSINADSDGLDSTDIASMSNTRWSILATR